MWLGRKFVKNRNSGFGIRENISWSGQTNEKYLIPSTRFSTLKYYYVFSSQEQDKLFRQLLKYYRVIWRVFFFIICPSFILIYLTFFCRPLMESFKSPSKSMVSNNNTNALVSLPAMSAPAAAGGSQRLSETLQQSQHMASERPASRCSSVQQKVKRVYI